MLNFPYHETLKDTINFEEIEPGIRGLCYQLNRLDGVLTHYSCDGHSGAKRPWVIISCRDLGSLKRLTTALSYGCEWGGTAGSIATWIDYKWLLTIGQAPTTDMETEEISVNLLGENTVTTVDCERLEKRIEKWIADGCKADNYSIFKETM